MGTSWTRTEKGGGLLPAVEGHSLEQNRCYIKGNGKYVQCKF